MRRLREYAEAIVKSVTKTGDGSYDNDLERCWWALQEPYELAVAYLEEHPADDDEPITADWLCKNGWKVICNGTRASIEWITDHPIQLWKQDANRWHVTMGVVEFHVINTRGDVRRLCAALGIELKENQ